MDLKTYQYLTENGVKILHRESVYIEPTVKIGRNTVVEPFCVLLGNTVIEENCIIGSFCYLRDAYIMSGTEINATRVTESTVGQHCIVGPFARLRANAQVEDFCKVGNFVEIKNSNFGEGSKASHLAYVGDATVGKDCNIGCGAVFVNYDGRKKHRTTVGDGTFVGCNCNLIAPVNIGENCFIACGTTVTQDTQAEDFVIGRNRQTVKPQRAKNYLKEGK